MEIRENKCDSLFLQNDLWHVFKRRQEKKKRKFQFEEISTFLFLSVFKRYGNEMPYDYLGLVLQWASLVAQLVKNLPTMQETWVRSLGWEDPLYYNRLSYLIDEKYTENNHESSLVTE